MRGSTFSRPPMALIRVHPWSSYWSPSLLPSVFSLSWSSAPCGTCCAAPLGGAAPQWGCISSMATLTLCFLICPWNMFRAALRFTWRCLSVVFAFHWKCSFVARIDISCCIHVCLLRLQRGEYPASPTARVHHLSARVISAHATGSRRARDGPSISIVSRRRSQDLRRCGWG